MEVIIIYNYSNFGSNCWDAISSKCTIKLFNIIDRKLWDIMRTQITDQFSNHITEQQEYIQWK